MEQPILHLRLRGVIFVICIAFIAMGTHLFRLQISQMYNFFQLSNKNFMRTEKIPSARGNIIDIHGNLLATNRPVISLYWIGTGSKKLTENQLSLINLLQTTLELPQDIAIQIATEERKNKKHLIARDIPLDKLGQIIEKFPHHANIYVAQQFKRLYPHKSVASHVIGYLGSLADEQTGKMGLELLLNEELKGQSGELIKTINSVGKQLTQREVRQSLTGNTISTTFDLPLQLIAEEVFPENESGTMILLDPQQGDIKVMLSKPNFDPSMFLQTIHSETWQELQERHGFINRAIGSTYPPASLFKMVTLAAALEQKIITDETTWYCPGYIHFAGRRIQCGNHAGHGTIDTRSALAYSCNIPFYDIAKKIKIDTLAEYAYKLGLGAKTNILLPEREGLIPTTAWKKRVKGESWWPGETLSASIGQSYLLATPLQMGLMISALCEEYLIKPRILTSEEIIKKPLYISKGTLQLLKEYMKQVIRLGTGSKLKYLTEFEMYAKTGTAQTSDLKKRSLGKKFAEHGWFVCYFKYKNEKPLTLVVIIEHVGSSRDAINLALSFLTKYASHCEAKKIA